MVDKEWDRARRLVGRGTHTFTTDGSPRPVDDVVWQRFVWNARSQLTESTVELGDGPRRVAFDFHPDGSLRGARPLDSTSTNAELGQVRTIDALGRTVAIFDRTSDTAVPIAQIGYSTAETATTTLVSPFGGYTAVTADPLFRLPHLTIHPDGASETIVRHVTGQVSLHEVFDDDGVRLSAMEVDIGEDETAIAERILHVDSSANDYGSGEWIERHYHYDDPAD